jgi:hypothetical protein
MKKAFACIGLAILIGTSGGTALAQGADDFAPGKNRDAVLILFGTDTIGEAIAGEVYGNTTNERAGGNGVTPTLAPGPWACPETGSCFDGVGAGGAMGEFITTNAGVGNADFANGTDEVKTNFGEPYEHDGVQP